MGTQVKEKPGKSGLSPKSPGPLKTGDVVVIIGGAPAGSGCAIRLIKQAHSRDIHPRVIIYEGKRFEKKSYYNQCLGVLSSPIDRILEDDLYVPFPHHLVQRRIKGYVLHTKNSTLSIPSEREPSFATRRVEFDNYLFQAAKDLGAEIVPARVVDLDFGRDSIMVYSESNNIRADMVIGAFGLDDGMAKIFERLTPYRQPKFLSTIVTKIHPSQDQVEAFGDSIHAFLISSLRKIEYAAITPKGNHLAINLAGQEVSAVLMDAFLNFKAVRDILPADLEEILPKLTYFKGKFPTLPAKGAFGDRYVMIGDAAGFNRPFKGKGINSALITGIKAADVLLEHGYTHSAFGKYMDSCKELTCDVPYGRVLRAMTNTCSRFGLLDGICETAKEEPSLRKAFFNIVSGHESYRKTWKETKSLRLFLKIAARAVKFRLSKSSRRGQS
jgi:flavin-dependent dehydrogenase